LTDNEGRPIDLYGNGYMMMRNICIGKPVLAGYLTPTVAVSTRMCRGGGGVWLVTMSWKPISQVPTAENMRCICWSVFLSTDHVILIFIILTLGIVYVRL